MLHGARSLCIIDEFGKGTLANDGVALLAAALAALSRSSPLPPRVVACTHFSELLDAELLPRRAALAVVTLECSIKDALCKCAVRAGCQSAIWHDKIGQLVRREPRTTAA